MATTRRILSVLCVSSALCMGVGCSSSPSTNDERGGNDRVDNATDSEASTSETTSTGEGPATFMGQVKYTGDVPETRKIAVTKDVAVCGVAAGDFQDMKLGEGSGLSNAVVEIMGINAPEDGWTWDKPADSYELHQKDCMFSPYLMVMPNGSELKIYNDDKVGHNVNAPGFNEVQGPGADVVTKTIESRSPMRIQCNIHSWMEAWIYTVDSPHYAITDGDGNFSIESIPPGEYRIKVWHAANVKAPRTKIKFGAGDTVTQNIVIEK